MELVIRRRVRVGHEDARDAPCAQFGEGHRPGAGDRDVRDRERGRHVVDVRLGAHPVSKPEPGDLRGGRLVIRRAGRPEKGQTLGPRLAFTARDDGKVAQERLVHRPGALAAADDQHDWTLADAESRPHGRPINRRVGRCDRVAKLEHPGRPARFEEPAGLGEGEMDLIDPSGEPTGGRSGPGVLLLDRRVDASERTPRDDGAARVAASADDEIRAEFTEHPREADQDASQCGNQPPVLPDAGPANRLEGQQLVWHAALGQHPGLDTTPGTEEEDVGPARPLLESGGEGERGVQVSPRAAAGEEHARAAAHAFASFPRIDVRATDSSRPTAMKATRSPLRP